MATIKVVDNFSTGYSSPDGFKSSSQNNIDIYIDIGIFRQLPGCTLFSFTNSEKGYEDDELILSIRHQATISDKWFVQSGNFVGNIRLNNHSIQIQSRFSETFLQRMLQAINNVYLAEIDGVERIEVDYARFLLYTLFAQKLEKAFLLGLPKVYRNKNHHDSGVKGRVHISGLIKRDMPYKGKISSQQRVREVDESIVSVLFLAANRVLNEYKHLVQNIRHISTGLRQLNPKSLEKDTYAKAIASKALTNPIFSPYKQVLSLAKLILDGQSIQPSKDGQRQSFGFLVNVAELFELYVTALLKRAFSDWVIESPKVKLYEDHFYERNIIPDIVMRKGNRVAVFDTKYKKMNYRGKDENGMGDVDRLDFFQIHTYMSYYQSQPDIEFIGGGLLYPLSEGWNRMACFSQNVLGHNHAWFCVDGIEIPTSFSQNHLEKTTPGLSQSEPEADLSDLIKKEEDFIGRIRSLIGA
jgi:5-methylcytosine-specific restriction endonuclease McrBC regulatory subunit McrC